MWTWLHTVSKSLTAKIVSFLKSLGCGDVNLILLRPFISFNCSSNWGKYGLLLLSIFKSLPYEFTFCPNNVISLTPSSTRCFASLIISPGLLLISGPLTDGTIQNVQELLHPIWIVSHAENSDSRIDGASVGKFSIFSIISVTGPQSSAWFNRFTTLVRLWVPITTSTHGAFSLTRFLSFWAAQPPTSNLLWSFWDFHFFNWPRVP